MKPTLQEIANMPHSIAVMAMREHYDPEWPLVTSDPEPETDEDDEPETVWEDWYG